MAALTFYAPDEDRFPALRLAKECQQKGQTATAVMNAANEVAVGAFLKRRIGFLDIVRIVEKVVEMLPLDPVSTIQDVMAVDGEARKTAESVLQKG